VKADEGVRLGGGLQQLVLGLLGQATCVHGLGDSEEVVEPLLAEQAKEVLLDGPLGLAELKTVFREERNHLVLHVPLRHVLTLPHPGLTAGKWS
jgi:hypothetical protein